MMTMKPKRIAGSPAGLARMVADSPQIASRCGYSAQHRFTISRRNTAMARVSATRTRAARRSRVSQQQAEDAVRLLLQWAGEEPSREGLRDTPTRVVRAYKDWFSGYLSDPADYLRRT